MKISNNQGPHIDPNSRAYDRNRVKPALYKHQSPLNEPLDPFERTPEFGEAAISESISISIPIPNAKAIR